MASEEDSSPPPLQVCPVDHKSREAWLDAARQENQTQHTTSSSSSSFPPPSATPAPPNDASSAECPVDHKSRQAWLNIARQQDPSQPPSSSPSTTATTTTSSTPLPTTCDSSTMTDPSITAPLPRSQRPRGLSDDREISTIPRSFLDSSSPSPASPLAAKTASHSSSSSSPNAESPTDPHTSATGNWIYPSESMFFAAMRRKNLATTPSTAADMSSVIPIHNAVNERTWHEIKNWEAGRGADSCGGPKLVSFSGNSAALTPRARVYGWLGYARPFDRHDWVVDRCGRRVEYVIDFYAGKPAPGGTRGEGLSFYLDVRPKLNSWEGCRMRIARTFGF